jgi:hypothetical protein
MGIFISHPASTILVQVKPIASTLIESPDTCIGSVNTKTTPWFHYITNKKTKNHTEEKRMRADIATYGKYDKGFYKDIPWEMHRVSLGGYSEHWCGYVLYNGDITDDELELIEEKAHDELTAHIGLNCAHCDDYTASHTSGTYRDHAYVLNCLQDMIDVLIETKSFDKQKFRDFASMEMINNF